MSLFLSKLLPVFIYPLGLSSLLMLLALVVLLWKKRSPYNQTSPASRTMGLYRKNRFAAWSLGLAISILWLSSNNLCSQWLVQSLEWQYLPSAELPQAEAIVVLGGGTRPRIAPRPWYEVNEAGDRILYGSWLYKQGKAPLLIVSGGRADWLGEGGNPESEDMAAIAQLMAVPSEAIMQEPKSLNTYENAIYTRQILVGRQINKILLVTSALHMPRSLQIFRKIGIEAIAAPTDFLSVKTNNDKGLGILLELLPNPDALRNSTNAIKEYLGIWAYQIFGWA
ncbi:MAG: YdcF family protein [Pseudanabaenaceae cyanobacterium bins.39]|nr:YdcF family protein [Pseudanabaenaceae cyanobacterium bins.39]